MFSVTTKAADEIRKLLAEENIPDAVLRVRVVPGGCSGFSYEMGFDDVDQGRLLIREQLLPEKKGHADKDHHGDENRHPGEPPEFILRIHQQVPAVF